MLRFFKFTITIALGLGMKTFLRISGHNGQLQASVHDAWSIFPNHETVNSPFNSVINANNNGFMSSVRRLSASLALDQWEQCYPGSDSPHQLKIGIGVGSAFFENRLRSVDVAVEWVASAVAHANIIYVSQLNVSVRRSVTSWWWWWWWCL